MCSVGRDVPAPCTIGTGATTSRTVSAICAHARLLVADEVVDAVLGLGRQRRDDPRGQVLHVDELPRLAPVARDRERLAA